MNEKLEKCLRDKDEVILNERNRVLINLNLTEREMSPKDYKTSDCPKVAYVNGAEKYYREVPIKITDEEWELLQSKLRKVAEIEKSKKVIPKPKHPSSLSPISGGENTISAVLIGVAVTLAIITAAMGIIVAVIMESAALFFAFALSAAFQTLPYFAFAEIIKSLTQIRDGFEVQYSENFSRGKNQNK
ncbi:MAG: hypothetical protein LUG52_07515 [Clostridia bacterium]|nr:hypothetical protein [Clostridia bacterium]